MGEHRRLFLPQALAGDRAARRKGCVPIPVPGGTRLSLQDTGGTPPVCLCPIWPPLREKGKGDDLLLEGLTRFFKDKLIRSRRFNATRMVAISFGALILLGAALLTMPFSTRSGESVGFFNALFTATSATCVTGLVVADTYLTWSPFGQAVILLLIQLGGLGFMTVITIISLAAHRRISLSERLLMVSTLNLNDLDGVVRVVRRALFGTALFEGAGALLLWTRMAPRYGLLEGLWHAVFHSISAFCNAGFDLQGGDTGAFSSLMGFQSDPVTLLTTAALVIIGGLGFFVWDDILEQRKWRKLSLYSRLVLSLTVGLLAVGTLFFFAVERNNPATLGPMPLPRKWLNAFFQSATLRTAGFNAIDQGAMRENSLVMGCVLMLIGGASGSTAGGMKIVTAWVLLMVLVSGLKGGEEIHFRERSLPLHRAMNAVNLFLVVTALFLVGSLAIAGDGVPYLSAAFETASALGTVGLTTGITPGLPFGAKALLILLMYTGRVGVLSISLAFLIRPGGNPDIKYPKFDILIG